jgi:hypothetical protein
LIAGLAAAVALGGTAYAASKINGKNIVKQSITGDRLKSDTLTGSQIRESKLAEVPKSKLATSAQSVDGATVQTFSFTILADGATRTVNVPGGVVSAVCPGGKSGLLVLGSADSGLAISIAGADSDIGGYAGGGTDITTTGGKYLTPGYASGTGGGVAFITRPAGKETTIDFSYIHDAGTSCILSGTVIAAI